MTLKLDEEKKFILSFSASIIVHLIIAAGLIFYFKITISETKVSSPYVQIETNVIEKPVVPEKENVEIEKELIEEKNEPAETEDENIIKTEKDEEEKPEEPEPETSFNYLAFTDENIDTTALEQIYTESTLNVKVKYPVGWTYIDQNVKGKLDGVSFWSAKKNYDPPPYIFIEVKEKYMFNENRYKFNKELDDAIAYYNDPEKLSGTVSQEFYIRTETDEDFSIKLIMEGEEPFKSFQPVFFGMLKTFEFGNSLF